jgi:uncharacterized protein YqjF (DUF2071 family)
VTDRSWITRQRWEKIHFLHFRGAADVVRAALPPELELDLWENEAVLSAVPFRMTRVRFPYLPPLPGIGSLWELNLRTYVRYGAHRGVYFFTLESNNPVATWIAQKGFGLPYANAKFRVQADENHFAMEHQRADIRTKIQMHTLVDDSSPQQDPFAIWATERYALINVRAGRVFRGALRHERWPLKNAKVDIFEGNFLSLVPGAENFRFCGAGSCGRLDVSFRPFEELSTKLGMN